MSSSGESAASDELEKVRCRVRKVILKRREEAGGGGAVGSELVKAG